MSYFIHSKLYLFLTLIYVLRLAQLSDQKIVPSESFECNPAPDPDKSQYVIGYGSLIQSKSKNRTYQNTGVNEPILVTGYSRVWNCKGVSASLSTTYLGIVPKRSGTLNGVMFRIPGHDALDAYDERELYYCREEVDSKMITALNSARPHLPHHGQFWIYVTKPQYTSFPTKEYPIIQSYVDVFLSGCFDIQKKYNLANFAEDCVKTSDGWNDHWVNDRVFPRRAYVFEPAAVKIDKLLARLLPNQFKSVKLE